MRTLGDRTLMSNGGSMKKKIKIGVVGMAIFVAGVAAGQAPEQDIGRRFPNLMAAQQYCRQAFDAISAAQQANGQQLGGHAQRAKELLDQASHELKEAQEYVRHTRR
jgi:nucleoside phosphorylase